jgi:hypothetical protein
LIAALLTASALLLTPATALHAQESQIVLCPANEVDLGVTTDLPEGWEDTPRRGRLTAARIELVDEEPVLTCLYEVDGERIVLSRRPPETAMACKIGASGLSFVCNPRKKLSLSSELKGKICQASIQNQVAWDYSGRNRWVRSNLERICRNAENSLQPGVCFERVMHGGIDHGNGTRWRWPIALRLCAGTLDAQATISCFSAAIDRQTPSAQAIEACRVKP